ncbi:hypothetical protein D3C84_954050 [compost metagenome]
MLFTSAIDLFHRFGVTATIEMSPKLLLSEFVKENLPQMKTYCYGLFQDKQKLDGLFKADTNFAKDMPNFAGRCLSILVATENHNRNQAEYKEVIQIYEKMKAKYNASAGAKEIVKQDTHAEALELLIKALRVKKLEPAKIKHCVKALLDETNSFYQFDHVLQAL